MNFSYLFLFFAHLFLLTSYPLSLTPEYVIFKPMVRYPAVLFFCLSLGGCWTQSPEELDRLVKEDPAFKQMIVARDQAHQQIRLIKEDLLARKKQIESQAQKMRADYDAVAKTQNKKIEQYRIAIEANRKLLKTQIESESAQLADKESELEGYRKTLGDVKKVLNEGKGISLSKAERQKWEERILMLSEKMRPLTDEIQELKLQIRLKKQKIQYLR